MSKMTRAEMVKLPEHTQVLSNNRKYTMWRSKDYTEHKNIVNQWLMTQRNDKQLKEMYGRCSFANGDDWEYYTRVWIVEYEGETYLIYSSEKGTSYEMVLGDYNNANDRFYNSDTIGEKIIAFIDHLIGKMRQLESNQANIAEWNKFEKEMKEKDNDNR